MLMEGPPAVLVAGYDAFSALLNAALAAAGSPAGSAGEFDAALWRRVAASPRLAAASAIVLVA